MAHQKEAVLKLASGKILVGDVGSGKTLTAVAHYVAAWAPRDVYVITTAKKRDSLDWEDEFIKFGVWKTDDSTFHGKLTVDSWNNIKKYTEVEDAFFIFDEQRLVGSGAWTKSFYKIAKRNGWILLSATPGDTWIDYIPVFVANGFYRNKTEFIRRHVVFSPFTKYPKVQRYLETGVLVRHRNAIQVVMPYARHTTRHIHRVEVDYDPVTMRRVFVDRWNIFTEEPLKDIADMFRVSRKLVNSDPSRLSTVRSLLEKHPRLIVFYNFDYELEQLRTLSSDDGLSESNIQVSPSSTITPTSHSSSVNGSRTPGKSTSGINGSLAEESMGTSASQRAAMERPAFPDDLTSRRNDDLLQIGPGSSKSPSARTSEEKSSAGVTDANVSEALTADLPARDVEEGEKCQDSESKSPEKSSKNSSVTGSTQAGGDGSSLVVAEWNGHKHEPVPTSDRWVYLVQFAAGAEGWNCITTDAMCFYSLPYSYKLWHQAHGRIDRLNTLYFDLHYYVLVSRSWIDDAIGRALRSKKSFNEASWGRKAA